MSTKTNTGLDEGKGAARRALAAFTERRNTAQDKIRAIADELASGKTMPSEAFKFYAGPLAVWTAVATVNEIAVRMLTTGVELTVVCAAAGAEIHDTIERSGAARSWAESAADAEVMREWQRVRETIDRVRVVR